MQKTPQISPITPYFITQYGPTCVKIGKLLPPITLPILPPKPAPFGSIISVSTCVFSLPQTFFSP
jgi:hypothetical protein